MLMVSMVLVTSRGGFEETLEEIIPEAGEIPTALTDSATGVRVRQRFPETWLWDSIYSGYDTNTIF